MCRSQNCANNECVVLKMAPEMNVSFSKMAPGMNVSYLKFRQECMCRSQAVAYTHIRATDTPLYLVSCLLLENKSRILLYYSYL